MFNDIIFIKRLCISIICNCISVSAQLRSRENKRAMIIKQIIWRTYLIASDEISGVEPERLIVTGVKDNFFLWIIIQFVVEAVTELVQMAQVVGTEVEVKVFVDDVILDVEVLAVSGRFRFVSRFEGCKV